MNKIKYSGILLLAVLLLSRCQTPPLDHSFMNGTYIGTIPEITVGDEKQAAFSTFIVIDQKGINVQGRKIGFQLASIESLVDSTEYAEFQSDVKLLNTTKSYRFYFDKKQKTLKAFDVINGEDIVFESRDTLIKQAVNEYISVKLTTDTTLLSDKEKQMLPLLFEAANVMNELFWYDCVGSHNEVLKLVKTDDARKLLEINYGPWNRLKGNKSFVLAYAQKPAGANFYPADMTKKQFEQWDDSTKTSQYTFIRRKAGGQLYSVPYHVQFEKQVKKVADLLNKAAQLSEDKGFKKYLELRAQALLTDNYFESDMAWMDMKTNKIDIVIGPIENYEDALFGYKSAHEAYILVKDMAWSERLAKYAKLLPALQKGLPVDEKYKAEKPGSKSDLNAYDVIFYAGDCNSGSKTIAINLPNDSRVQLAKGSRRLQLKNAMKAKFDNILLPISEILISKEQRKYITFDAFFSNTMFHEVAHGLGIKETINGKGKVRTSLKEQASALEEGKADILGLYMIGKLKEMGELDVNLMENYVTFMAGIFRSIRFGASSAHARANLLRFNYFNEKKAFTKNADGTYSIDFQKMNEAMNSLSELILTIQGDGDYDRLTKLMNEKATIGNELRSDLDRLKEAKIPVDVVFEQGIEMLGN